MGSTNPLTDAEHAQFREQMRETNQRVREALTEELGTDVDEYPTETPAEPFTADE